ncbi:GNAT family N-acetyltransferase [Psychromonas hadalis]|uniref:GNAT family N-acetyltransferase n=1 Tax=Psychromonas hadalis TaxID=211669 RepID=UPI0003B30278|nr:GNAT family N-acetyltransferase [Psychromonas hadalis]
MSISVKRAVLENLNEVSELFNSYRVFYKQDSDLVLAVSFISDRLKNKDSVIFYAHDESGNALGFTQLYPTFSSVSAESSWVLNDLYVSSDARRLGVGKALMETAKAFAIETNSKGIALETCEDNFNAQALYESLGYEKDTGVYNYFLSL